MNDTDYYYNCAYVHFNIDVEREEKRKTKDDKISPNESDVQSALHNATS